MKAANLLLLGRRVQDSELEHCKDSLRVNPPLMYLLYLDSTLVQCSCGNVFEPKTRECSYTGSLSVPPLLATHIAAQSNPTAISKHCDRPCAQPTLTSLSISFYIPRSRSVNFSGRACDLSMRHRNICHPCVKRAIGPTVRAHSIHHRILPQPSC